MANDFETPKGVPYKGPSGVARDSVWLTNEDLPHDHDVPVQIECVVRRNGVKFQGGRVKPIMLSLKFVGKERELGLNATNRKILSMLSGTNECAAWFGMWIALYVEQGVRRPDGTIGPAVRIRPKRIDPPTSTPTAAKAKEKTADDREDEARRADAAAQE